MILGDSITHNGHREDLFLCVHIANCGVSSDRTDDVIHRLDTAFNANSKKFFVMVGINDLTQGRSGEDTLVRYSAVVRGLRTAGIEVVSQSTLESSLKRCGE